MLSIIEKKYYTKNCPALALSKQPEVTYKKVTNKKIHKSTYTRSHNQREDKGYLAYSAL